MLRRGTLLVLEQAPPISVRAMPLPPQRRRAHGTFHAMYCGSYTRATEDSAHSSAPTGAAAQREGSLRCIITVFPSRAAELPQPPTFDSLVERTTFCSPSGTTDRPAWSRSCAPHGNLVAGTLSRAAQPVWPSQRAEPTRPPVPGPAALRQERAGTSAAARGRATWRRAR